MQDGVSGIECSCSMREYGHSEDCALLLARERAAAEWIASVGDAEYLRWWVGRYIDRGRLPARLAAYVDAAELAGDMPPPD